MPDPGWLHVLLINKWYSNISEYSRGCLHYDYYKKKVIKPYIKKEQALVEAAFYVLFSAPQATLQKITVLLTQAKRGLQARARIKCQTKGIYLVTRLLPLITQHYCLCSVQPQLKTPWIKCGTNRRRGKTSDGGRSEAAWGWLDYSSKKKTKII